MNNIESMERLRRAALLRRLQQRDGGLKKSAGGQPIAPVDRSAPLPLSWSQQRLWFLDRMDHAASVAYHMPTALRLSGELRRDVLQATLDRIVERHESLRTRIVSASETPNQVIDPPDTGFHLVENDLSALPTDAREKALEEWCALEARRPFDLATGPLIRGRLLRLSESEHILLVTQHHIISDGWSLGILVREVSTLYAAFSQGEADPLPPLPLQYADYANWQRDRLQGEVLEGQVTYWRDHLVGAPALLELPTDRARPAVQSYKGGSVPIVLSAELTAGLRSLSQRHGATLFMTLLAGWSVLLSRLSGQQDVVIGTPVANRQRQELEALIGFFVNTLALRVQVDADPSVAQLLAQVKATALDAYAHQDLPFDQVVEAVKPVRSLGHSPIFQAMLALDNTPGGNELALPGLRLSPVKTDQGTAHFDLSLSLADDGERLVGSIEFASDLFEESTAERWVGHLQTLFAGMVADEACTVSQLPLLQAHEREQILTTFNATEVPYERERLIHELFEAQARRDGEAVALECDGQSLSYAELNRRANRVAHYLRARGLRPDDRVAICAERSFEMVVGLLGILKAGGGYVPLDPNYPRERLAYMLADSAPVMLLSQSSLRETLPATDIATLWLDQAPELAQQPEHDPDPKAVGLTSQHLAYVIYTSGSTGQPKGVMVEHGGLTHYLQWAMKAYGAKASMASIVSSPIVFDATITSLYTPLLSGGRAVLIRDGEELDGLEMRLGQSRTWGLIKITPAHLRVLGQRMQSGELRADPELFVVGGESLPSTTVSLWRDINPQSQLINEYGPTEAVVGCVVYEASRKISDSSEVPIGRPIANTQIHIVDAHLQLVPIGVAGELLIGGVQVARGYLNRPELTEQRFIANPFGAAGSRLYRTGDLGRWRADGTIEYLGRNDFQVKLRGFRIELGEIESQLTACAGVREAVVIAREDVPGDKRLVAYLVAHEGVELSVAGLREQLSRQLAEYMVPSAFVTLASLPLTPNGKLDRTALPAPGLDAVATREYEAPQGAAEQALATIWQELLGVARVGRQDHFFELGGHSLMVVSLIERLRQQGYVAQIRAVFMAPTLSALAASLTTDADRTQAAFVVPANAITPDSTAITPAMLPLAELSQAEIDGIVASVPGGVGNIQDIYRLGPLQEGILFHHLLEEQGDAYLLRSVMAFDGRERLDAFLGAVQRVIDRHDILRTAVRWTGLSQPVQVVQRHAPLPVQEWSLDGQVLPQLLERTDPRRMRLDLQRAPLLAAHVAEDRASGECYLALLNHHLVCDHVTLELLIGEIQAVLSGEEASLPAPLPYRNFIAQSRAVSAEEHEAYFREQLCGIDEPTLPFGLVDVQGTGAAVSEATLGVGNELAQRIREVARQQGVTPAALFHVAWAVVVGRCSGRDDVVFGTVLSGRQQGVEGADRALGMFINTLPLRIRLADTNVREAVRDTHAKLAELLTHEQASLALAQRCSEVAAPLPLFSAVFNYRHSSLFAAPDEGDTLQGGMRVLSGEERSNYPLALNLDDEGQNFWLNAQCANGVDPRRVVAYMRTAIDHLVGVLARDPQHRVDLIGILPPEEREQILTTFNATEVAYERERLIHELFEAQARRDGEAVALECDGQSLSYAELNRRANRVAHYLRARGLRPDDRVAICAERSFEMVVGLLGILKAGGGYVPLDPNYPRERLAYMLADSAPVMLLSQSSLRETLPATDIATLWLDQAPELAQQPEHDPDPKAVGLTSQHLAYVIYTSGSTGQPKGVVSRHQPVINLFEWVNGRFQVGPQDRLLFTTSLCFDLSVYDLFGILAAGGRVRVASRQEIAEPEALVRILFEEGITFWDSAPAVFRQLAPYLAQRPADAAEPALRLAFFSGDWIPLELPDVVRRAFPRCEVISLGGATEATVWSNFHPVREVQPHWVSIPYGRPIQNARYYVLDAQLNPVPLGVPGDLYIGGECLTAGYFGKPELTDSRFLRDRFVSRADGRMYKTGDRARFWADGTMEFLGRLDNQVKVRGFRIELGEIESQLAACAGVREALVMAREDVAGDKRLVAYLIAQGEAELSLPGLRAQLSTVLPEYMVPSAFVVLQELPLTPNGKIDHRALPAPDQSSVIARAYEAPQGEVEEAIAQVWRELLGLERVGRNDHFFELGGHSLLVITMTERLRQAGLAADVRLAFSTPTLSDMATAIVANEATREAAFVVPANLIPDSFQEPSEQLIEEFRV